MAGRGITAPENGWEARGRGLKVLRLALLLHEVGLRRAREVVEMTDEQRGLALAAYDAGLAEAGIGRAGASSASAETWRGVASAVGWLGGGSGGRRVGGRASNKLSESTHDNGKTEKGDLPCNSR